MLNLAEAKDNAIVLTQALDILIEFSDIGSLGQTASINGWCLSDKGQPVQFSKDLTSGTLGVFTSTLVSIPAGTLLGFVVSMVGSPTGYGTGYVRVSLVQPGQSGGPRIYLLAQGYVTQGVFLGWPGQQPASGPVVTGAQTQRTQANPAAGSDWSFNTGNIICNPLQFVCATLTTTVTVANRTVHLQIDDGSGVVVDIQSAVQIASTGVIYTWIGNPYTSIASAGFAVHQLPSIALGRNNIVKVVTGGLQAGDVWTNIRLQAPWQAAA